CPRRSEPRTGDRGPLPLGSGRLDQTRITDCLVTGLVFRDDVAGNPPALADLVATLTRPFPNLGTALPAWAGSWLAPAATCRVTPSMVGKCADLLAKFLAVRPT